MSKFSAWHPRVPCYALKLACLGTSGTVYVAIVGNENGGYFSREWLPVPRILDTIRSRLDTDQPTFPTRVLRSAFVNRSNNNGGFLAALLRHEALLLPGELPHLHRCSDDWDTWIDQRWPRVLRGTRGHRRVRSRSGSGHGGSRGPGLDRALPATTGASPC